MNNAFNTPSGESSNHLVGDLSSPSTAHVDVLPTPSGETSKPLIQGPSTPPSKQSCKPAKSLWQEAFDALQAAKPKRIKKYKDLASVVEDNNIPPDSPKGLQTLTKKALERMDEQKTNPTVREVINGAVKLIDFGKELITSAVKDIPPANIVWVGVCLVLPALTNPATAREANKTGFTYVTSQIEFYLALERSILSPSAEQAAQETLCDSISELYRLVIDFQIQSVLYLSRHSAENLVRDVVRYDDWEGMLSAIKEQEKEVLKRAEKIM
ncbi:hypothetical protein B0T22DRAFT_481616 [Podospora appendiculata]|uniref:NWD NACHT-NTPase N-terminal domain-containing protein n=1 Tax=Podospora appendiculata TaxID=314037 RepID=A0AAE1CE53_9PEZI|nr:hypothetical protein B0T22DRAFT_481616 [Podospora appendiculata]